MASAEPPQPRRVPAERLPPGAVRPRPAAERRGGFQLLRPTGFALAIMLFGLPFLTVSCTSPSGFGRVRPGGTTAYSGFDLAFGTEPHREPLLPADQWQPDAIAIQPLFLIALVLLVAGLVVPLLIRRIADRQRVSAGLAALGLATVIVAAAVAKSTLTDLVRLDAAARRVSLPRPADRYVANGQGLVLAVVTLVVVLAVELLGLNARRRASAAVRDAAEASRASRAAVSRAELRAEPHVGPTGRSPDPGGASTEPGTGRVIGGPWGIAPPRPASPRTPAEPTSPATPRDLGSAG